MRERRKCFFCGESSPVVLEKHHVLPKYGIFVDGENAPEVTFTLCANCHRKIHHMLKPLEEYNYILNINKKVEEIKGFFRFCFLLLDMIRAGKRVSEILDTLNMPFRNVERTLGVLEALDLIKRQTEDKYVLNL